MNGLRIRLIKNKSELKQVLKIREIVFITGQNVPEERELDGLDIVSKHVIVIFNGKPIGCARIRFIGREAKLERIAVLGEYRGKGFGKRLVNYLINYCKKKKVKEIVLHSQYYIRDFYAECGFKPKGKTFMDAGIKHIGMCMDV